MPESRSGADVRALVKREILSREKGSYPCLAVSILCVAIVSTFSELVAHGSDMSTPRKQPKTPDGFLGS